MPEQQRINNGNTCFNWFNPEDIARDSGEAAFDPADDRADGRRRTASIRGASSSPGFPPAARMTSVMLATYPEVFSAGAVIAGLPFGIAQQSCAKRWTA